MIHDEGELRSDEDSDLEDIVVPDSDPEDEKRMKEKETETSKAAADAATSSSSSTKSTVDDDGKGGESDGGEDDSSADSSGLGDLDSDPEKAKAQREAGKKRKDAKKGSKKKKKGGKKKEGSKEKTAEESEEKKDEIIQIDGKQKPKALYEGLSSDEDGDFEDFNVEDEKEVEKFIAAKSFQGPLPGYYFGTGKEGTGYYRDEYGEWTGSNCRKGKKWRKNKKKIEVKIREEEKSGSLDSSKKDGLILEVTDRASGGKGKDGKKDGKDGDGSGESSDGTRDFMGKKLFPSRFHMSHDIHITNNLTPAECKVWLLGRGLTDNKDKSKSTQKTPAVEVIRRGIVVPWETDSSDSDKNTTTPSKKPTPQLPLTNLRETMDKEVLSSTSRSDFTAQSTVPYFIAHETRANLVLAFPILELDGTPQEVTDQGKIPKIRVESSSETWDALRQIHLKIFMGEKDKDSEKSSSSASSKTNPNVPRSFVFQQAITQDLAVPQQWSSQTKILKSTSNPEKKSQVVVLFSIRKGKEWVKQSDVSWEDDANAAGDDSPIVVELDEDGKSGDEKNDKNGDKNDKKKKKKSTAGLTFVEEKPENLTWKTAEEVRGFSKIVEEDKKKSKKDDDLDGLDGETDGKERLLGDDGEEVESDDEVDVTKKTVDSLIFVREEEADATMGQAVILRNRLFYELM